MTVKNKVYIVHGYQASSQKHWFHWLKDELAPHQIEVILFDLPNTNHPKLAEWLDTLSSTIACNQNTIIIGHSLGCVSSLKYLQNIPDLVLKGIILVAGSYQKIKAESELNPFYEPPVDFPYLISKISKRYAIASLDDDTIPFDFSENLALALKAELITLDGYQHFCDCNGITTFPVLKNLLLNLFAT